MGDDRPVSVQKLKGRLVRSIHKPTSAAGGLCVGARSRQYRARAVGSIADDWRCWCDHPMEAHKVDSKGIYARGSPTM